ncbi:Fascin-like protein [Pandoravirus quercus]|uniref:Fascin-like protein n=1 Tax=Pandoravirus quercus TaxID=2107709 RepID=A0A2U7UA42_9VIRU|nr:Fascin-like protein [Pandoravirus quercus]AVK75304.1 Fascin-like protein [Pandoravirus quercus]
MTSVTMATSVLLALTLLLACAAAPIHGHRQSVFLTSSQTWSPPANATNIVLTIWGGGGGAAANAQCGAGGGSGAAIINRPAGDATWGLSSNQIQWEIEIGHGGAGNPETDPEGLNRGGDGGATHVVARAPNGTVLFHATAYGGGGASAESATACRGGGGGGANSSAVGPLPGGGNPPGAADNSASAQPPQGAMIGDIKAGGAGAGHGGSTFIVGANWTSPGRSWTGGSGTTTVACASWGGAAGLGGNGGAGQTRFEQRPGANSGAGGGSAYVCPPYRYYSDSPGGAGGVLIEYTHPVAPIVALRSSVSGKYLTAHSYGGVSANAVTAQAWERWASIRLDNGKYVFRSWQDKFLKANPTDSVEASSTTASTWEQFEAIDKGLGRWSLKNHYGKYVVAAADGFVLSTTDADHYWTVVTL